LLNRSRDFKFVKNRRNRGSTVPKHLHTLVITLATRIVMIAFDSNHN